MSTFPSVHRLSAKPCFAQCCGSGHRHAGAGLPLDQRRTGRRFTRCQLAEVHRHGHPCVPAHLLCESLQPESHTTLTRVTCMAQLPSLSKMLHRLVRRNIPRNDFHGRLNLAEKRCKMFKGAKTKLKLKRWEVPQQPRSYLYHHRADAAFIWITLHSSRAAPSGLLNTQCTQIEKFFLFFRNCKKNTRPKPFDRLYGSHESHLHFLSSLTSFKPPVVLCSLQQLPSYLCKLGVTFQKGTLIQILSFPLPWRPLCWARESYWKPCWVQAHAVSTLCFSV